MESSTPRRDVMGLVLILLGILILLKNLGIGLGPGEIWPWFIVLFGIAFGALFVADRSQYMLLMPAATLVVAGIIFAACTAFGWTLMGELWPMLIMAPGIGFLAMNHFGPGGTSLLVPGLGLVIGGIFMLVRQSPWWRHWPLLLVMLGLGLLIREFRRS